MTEKCNRGSITCPYVSLFFSKCLHIPFLIWYFFGTFLDFPLSSCYTTLRCKARENQGLIGLSRRSPPLNVPSVRDLPLVNITFTGLCSHCTAPSSFRPSIQTFVTGRMTGYHPERRIMILSLHFSLHNNSCISSSLAPSDKTSSGTYRWYPP